MHSQTRTAPGRLLFLRGVEVKACRTKYLVLVSTRENEFVRVPCFLQKIKNTSMLRSRRRGEMILPPFKSLPLTGGARDVQYCEYIIVMKF